MALSLIRLNIDDDVCYLKKDKELIYFDSMNLVVDEEIQCYIDAYGHCGQYPLDVRYEADLRWL